MKIWLPALACLTGLIVGFAGGWVLSDDDRTAHTTFEPPREVQDTPRDDPTPPLTDNDDAPPNVDEGEDDWLASLGVDPGPLGSGTFHGRVTAEDGEPLPGVVVTARPHLPDPEIAADATKQEKLKIRARQLAKEIGRERGARTDGDGRYEISGVDEEAYYALEAVRDGYEISPDGKSSAHLQPSDELNFSAKATVLITVDLSLPDGSRPDLAHIRCRPSDVESGGWRSWNWRPTERTRAMDPGAWRLEAGAGKYREYTSEPVSMELEPGDKPGPMSVPLKETPSIVGRVEPFEEFTGVRLTVELLENVAGEFRTAQKESDRPPFGRWESGEFAFVDLEPGNYRVQVKMRHVDEPVMTEDVTVTDEVVHVVLKPPAPDANDYIVVRVLGPDGPVSEGLYVEFNRRTKGSGAGGSETVLNRGNGEYWVRRDEDWFGESEGWYEIGVQSQTHGSKEAVRYERTDTHVLEFRFEDPAYVIVTVPGLKDHPERESLEITLGGKGERLRGSPFGRHMRRREPESIGTRKFGPLEPGTYNVALLLNSERRWDSRPLVSKTVEVVSGESDVELAIPKLYSFTVEISEEIVNRAQVSVRKADDFDVGITNRDKSEVFVVENLTAGDYVIWANTFGQMKVSLPAMDGRRVRFEPQPFNAYWVVSFNRNRTNADDLGFELNDHVVEVDGTPLEGNFERRLDIFREAYAKESTTWVVIRDGVRVPVTFDGRKRARSGVRMMPGRVD